jgi:glycosyltransferase involved in cell wall biosynthesis
MASPKVSICIPVYRNPTGLRRALASVAKQTYRDFEVIVTDDSPEEGMEAICREFEGSFPCRYVKNPSSLGSPKNWNRAIELGSGEYVKLLHHDDFFLREDSLAQFVGLMESEPGVGLVWSGSIDSLTNGNFVRHHFTKIESFTQIKANPSHLFSGNYIGAPSVTMFRRSKELFDERLKWFVDVEFYFRYLNAIGRAAYTPDPLIGINVGSAEQVTSSCVNDPRINLYEGTIFYRKILESRRMTFLVFTCFLNMLSKFEARSPGQFATILGKHDLGSLKDLNPTIFVVRLRNLNYRFFILMSYLLKPASMTDWALRKLTYFFAR